MAEELKSKVLFFRQVPNFSISFSLSLDEGESTESDTGKTGFSFSCQKSLGIAHQPKEPWAYKRLEAI